MARYEQTIIGYNRLQNKFRRIAADNPEIGDEPIREFAQDARGDLKAEPYPPKRQGQRYIRTGQLANRWKTVKEREGQYSIVNEASNKGRFYASFVVGQKQAWMHKGRWWKAKDVVLRNIDDLRAKLRAAYEKIWTD